ncbi:MAG: tRNA (guanosine(37)-N1)-methyltransferase TrmD [Lachnospiraceae bacterium]|nr:tRNA (guanosine(37)-N1)-methyltransferase TrmD [Lachnospiraceae bacterium]
MKITILTICPEIFEDFLRSHSIARAEKLGLLQVKVRDIRDYAKGSFRAIDDSPYGGGRGMLLRCEPVVAAIREASGEDKETLVAALTPGGRTYDQQQARELAGLEHLVLVCGHYEGFDERILHFVDREISLGDYILSGGEIGAMAVADSIARLLPGNLKEGSAEEESFESSLLEYPQYTRPADFEGLKVPEVLLQGDHGAVEKWRKEAALQKTRERRPDLLDRMT